MDKLEDLFSFQKEYIEAIDNFFELKNQVVILQGKSGVGKTFIGNSYLSSRDNYEKIVCSFSDISLSTTDHRELKLAIFDNLTQNVKNKIRKQQLSKSLSKISQDIPHVGNTIDALLDFIFNRKINIFKSDTLNLFREGEIEIVDQLYKLTKEKPLVILFDNAHWMSTNTFLFIENLLRTSRKLLKNEIFIILTETTNQKSNPDIKFDFVNRILIKDISISDYSEAMAMLYPEAEVQKDILKILFSLTGGHLALTKSLIKILRNHAKENILEIISNYQLHIKNEEQILDTFLDFFNRMLLQYFSTNNETIKTLEVASIIGNIFSKEELSKLIEENHVVIEDYIKYAEQNLLAVNEHKVARFTHPLIRELFFKRLNGEQKIWHKKYAECLRILRPTEPMLVALHYQYARDDKNAIKYYILGYFKCLKNNIEIPSNIYQYVENRIKEFGLYHYFHSIKKAIEEFKSNRITDAIKTLEYIDEIDIPIELFVHYKNLLYAEYITQQTFEFNILESAVEVLEKAKEFFINETEIELTINSLLLLLNIYCSKFSNFEKTKRTESQFSSLYQKYFQNSNLEQYYFEYKRKSIVMCTPEIAHRRMQECVNYYSNKKYSDVEYYKSLCNYSGTQIYLGEYSKAIETIDTCTNIMQDSPLIYFPEVSKIANNYVLASYLSSKISRTTTFNERWAIDKLNSSIANQDYYSRVIDINMANFYGLSGNIEKAKNILYKIEKGLIDNQDPFYSVHVYSNLASLHYIEKKTEKALSYLEQLDKYLSKLVPGTKAFYKKRTEFFVALIQSGEVLSSEQLLLYFTEKYPKTLGPSWRFVGLGFLFSDLQFYTS